MRRKKKKEKPNGVVPVFVEEQDVDFNSRMSMDSAAEVLAFIQIRNNAFTEPEDKGTSS